MAEVTIFNSPVHSQIILTYPYGVPDSSYQFGYHTGVDFAPYGLTERNPVLYSCVVGTVVYVNLTTNVALGVQVLIRDLAGRYWRYCHMVEGSVTVNVGDSVNLQTRIGRMGATGNVTGIHLHLECSETDRWSDNRFLNPCTYLRIPNVDNTIINYGDVPVPTEPTKKRTFNWTVFMKKIKSGRKWR